MPTSPDNRKTRRARSKLTKKVAAATGATMTAAALTAGISAPVADAAATTADVKLAASDITIDAVTTGPLLGLVAALGLNNFTFPLPSPPLPEPGNFVLNLNWTNSNPQNVSNTINDVALTDVTPGFSPCGLAEAEKCRLVPFVVSSLGAIGAAIGVDALWASAGGAAPQPGYDPIAGAGGDRRGLTDLITVMVNDPLRPDGGILARFAPLLNALGIDTTLPNSGPGVGAVSGAANGAKMVNNLLDVGWEYNPFGDFPATLNPFSLANSLLAFLPSPELLSVAPMDVIDKQTALAFGVGGPSFPAGDPEVASYIGAAALPWLLGGEGTKGDPVQRQLFLTIVANQLPLLEPLRLPSQLINMGLKALKSPYLLGTPIADILEPALKILVNIGYSDVVTPTAIVANPELLKYGPYGRTFAQPTTPATLGLGSLSLQELIAVPGDVLGALVKGVTDQLKKPLFGILVPNTPPTATPTVAAIRNAPAPAAASSVAEAATEDEPVAVDSTAGDEPVALTATIAADPSPAPTATLSPRRGKSATATASHASVSKPVNRAAANRRAR